MPALTLHYPSGYGSFSCTGSRCPMTCCAGWRITIDKASAREYRREGGRFGRRLHMAVDHKFLKCILSIRGHMFHILYSRELPLYWRMAAILAMGHDVGRCAGNENRAVEMAGHYEQWVFTSNFEERLAWVFKTIPTGFDSAQNAEISEYRVLKSNRASLTPRMVQYIRMLLSLEVIVPQWHETLEDCLCIVQNDRMISECAASVFIPARLIIQIIIWRFWRIFYPITPAFPWRRCFMN